MSGLALVLGGGGVTGIAWETGLLYGLAEAGVDLSTADLIIGTSAGSVVGTQIATGIGLRDLYTRQLQPVNPAVERLPQGDFTALLRTFANRPPRNGPTPVAECAAIGQAALAATTEPEESRIAAISARLPEQEWPERRLLVTAIDAEDGRFVAWDKDSEAPLLLAVASSCAVPIIYPPITIGQRRYIDGGMRSGTNADLAAGAAQVVIIAPMAAVPTMRGALDAEVRDLEAAGSTVKVIWPDENALAAIGANLLDPARRIPSAQAGLAQAATAAEQVRQVVGNS